MLLTSISFLFFSTTAVYSLKILSVFNLNSIYLSCLSSSAFYLTISSSAFFMASFLALILAFLSISISRMRCLSYSSAAFLSLFSCCTRFFSSYSLLFSAILCCLSNYLSCSWRCFSAFLTLICSIRISFSTIYWISCRYLMLKIACN